MAVVEVLQRLETKGVDWHVLGWTNFLETDQNLAFAKRVNAIQAPPARGGAYFVCDDRVPDTTASHHQMTVVITQPQGLITYIGGTDLTWDRITTSGSTRTRRSRGQQRPTWRPSSSSGGTWSTNRFKISSTSSSRTRTHRIRI